MVVKVTKGGVALYQKINVTRSVENFILVSEIAQGWYYAALLLCSVRQKKCKHAFACKLCMQNHIHPSHTSGFKLGVE